MFTLLDGYACEHDSDVYGVYNNIADAKVACSDDTLCGKVCDKYCDESVITLCTKGSSETPSTQLGSCLYKHIRNSEYRNNIVITEFIRQVNDLECK